MTLNALIDVFFSLANKQQGDADLRIRKLEAVERGFDEALETFAKAAREMIGELVESMKADEQTACKLRIEELQRAIGEKPEPEHKTIITGDGVLILPNEGTDEHA